MYLQTVDANNTWGIENEHFWRSEEAAKTKAANTIFNVFIGWLEELSTKELRNDAENQLLKALQDCPISPEEMEKIKEQLYNYYYAIHKLKFLQTQEAYIELKHEEDILKQKILEMNDSCLEAKNLLFLFIQFSMQTYTGQQFSFGKRSTRRSRRRKRRSRRRKK